MIMIKRLFVSATILLMLDFIYLSLTKPLFEDLIVNVQRVILQFKPLGAIICYFFLILGLNYFIIQHKKSIVDAFILGLVIYAVYDSTNYAVLKKWDPYLAIMDTLWGGTLFALTTHLTYIVV